MLRAEGRLHSDYAGLARDMVITCSQAAAHTGAAWLLSPGRLWASCGIRHHLYAASRLLDCLGPCTSNNPATEQPQVSVHCTPLEAQHAACFLPLACNLCHQSHCGINIGRPPSASANMQQKAHMGAPAGASGSSQAAQQLPSWVQQIGLDTAAELGHSPQTGRPLLDHCDSVSNTWRLQVPEAPLLAAAQVLCRRSPSHRPCVCNTLTMLQVPEIPLVVDDSAEGLKKTKGALALLVKVGAIADAEKAKSSRNIRCEVAQKLT